MKIKVGVIFGGESVEHEISIITACQAMKNMDTDKYDIVPIYISKDRTWYTGGMLKEVDVFKEFEDLKKFATKVVLVKTERGFELQKVTGLFRKTVDFIDIAFPIVHGKGVEDGSLAGYLESIGIPVCESNVLASALGQDKVLQKQVLNAQGIKTPKYVWFYDSEYLNDPETINKQIKKLGYPVIVKPANLGSSIGIKIAKDENELTKAINDAISYDNKIVVEEMIKNLQEVNCAVLGNYEYQETSSIIEMKTGHAFLTFEDKYIGNGKKKGSFKAAPKRGEDKLVVEAKLTKELEEKVREVSKATFKALNFSGVVRIDLLIDTKAKEVYVNEPNTIPGSLSFFMWKNQGKSYRNLLDDIISLSIKEYKNKSKKITSFDSNVLSSYSGSKGMKGSKKF